MGWFSSESKKDKILRKVQKLEREWDEAVSEGDEHGAAYLHKEIKDTWRRAERKGWLD